jgi:hypothetical protein
LGTHVTTLSVTYQLPHLQPADEQQQALTAYSFLCSICQRIAQLLMHRPAGECYARCKQLVVVVVVVVLLLLLLTQTATEH